MISDFLIKTATLKGRGATVVDGGVTNTPTTKLSNINVQFLPVNQRVNVFTNSLAITSTHYCITDQNLTGTVVNGDILVIDSVSYNIDSWSWVEGSEDSYMKLMLSMIDL